jgi:hypothetical protein
MQQSGLAMSQSPHIADQIDKGCLHCRDFGSFGICMQAWMDNPGQLCTQVLQQGQLNKTKNIFQFDSKETFPSVTSRK